MQLYSNYKKKFFQEVGQAIRSLRLANDLQMEELKEITGYTCKRIADIEAGEDSRLLTMRLSDLFKIFEYFGKKFRLVIEDLTCEDRVGEVFRMVPTEDLEKLLAIRKAQDQQQALQNEADPQPLPQSTMQNIQYPPSVLVNEQYPRPPLQKETDPQPVLQPSMQNVQYSPVNM